MTKFDVWADGIEFQYESHDFDSVEALLFHMEGSSNKNWLLVQRSGYIEYIPWSRVQRVRLADQNIAF